jgi:hypothetical protein
MLLATLEGAVTVVFMNIYCGFFMTYFLGGVFFIILIGDFFNVATGLST